MDAADISRAVRVRLKARGEVGQDERVYAAISRTGETYDMPLAVGDKVRLYSKTSATIDGWHGFIGSNGDVVQIAGWTPDGVVMRDVAGREGAVKWSKLTDQQTGRKLLGFGHALTVDSAQGITTGEHINALPRGTAGSTGFKSYTAESRHVTQVYTMISEAALFEAVKHRRALGDQPSHALPRRAIPLATPAQGASPKVEDVVAETREGARVRGHRMIGKETPHHRTHPLTLLGLVLMPASPEFFLDLQELRHLPVTARVAGQDKAPFPRPRADMREAQEIEGLRLALSPRRPVERGIPAEFDQAGFVGVQFQGKLRHPGAYCLQDPRPHL